MQVLQTYNWKAMRSDMIARGWLIKDIMEAANRLRVAEGQEPLLRDVYARFLRGDSHSNRAAASLAAALGKTEAEYRLKGRDALPPPTTPRRRATRSASAR